MTLSAPAKPASKKARLNPPAHVLQPGAPAGASPLIATHPTSSDAEVEATTRSRSKEAKKQTRAWREFTRDTKQLSNGKCTHSHCNHCGERMSHCNVSTMGKHLKSACKKYLLSTQAEECTDKGVIEALKQHQQILRAASWNPTASVRPVGQQPITSFAGDRTSTALQESITSALMDVIIQCSLPHSLVENKYFGRLLKLLRSSYDLPSRWQVSNTLLNEKFDAISAEVTQVLDGAGFLTLTMDGWSLTQVRRQTCLLC